MNESSPWSNRDASELERKLLDAARADRIPQALSRRMRSALSAPAAVSGGLLWSQLRGKLAAWSLISLAVLGGAAAWHAQQRAPVAARTGAHADSKTLPALATPAETSLQFATQAPAVISSKPVDDAPRAAAVSGKAQGPTSASSLAAEIATLDRARAALQRGVPEQALRALRDYAQRFARGGSLQPEAEALRIEAWSSSGDRALAREHARRFLHAHPGHPLGARVAELAR
jgi:hypothetical protein